MAQITVYSAVHTKTVQERLVFVLHRIRVNIIVARGAVLILVIYMMTHQTVFFIDEQFAVRLVLYVTFVVTVIAANLLQGRVCRVAEDLSLELVLVE